MKLFRDYLISLFVTEHSRAEESCCIGLPHQIRSCLCHGSPLKVFSPPDNLPLFVESPGNDLYFLRLHQSCSNLPSLKEWYKLQIDDEIIYHNSVAGSANTYTVRFHVKFEYKCQIHRIHSLIIFLFITNCSVRKIETMCARNRQQRASKDMSNGKEWNR